MRAVRLRYGEPANSADSGTVRRGMHHDWQLLASVGLDSDLTDFTSGVTTPTLRSGYLGAPETIAKIAASAGS